MQVFWDGKQLGHSPAFFLQRGITRRHFEVPARAEVLLEACKALGLAIVEPPSIDPARLQAVHTADYIAFLKSAIDDWDALPDHGPEVVANIHPTPEMLGQGARISSTIVGRAGWYTADTACPIGPGTWLAALAAASCAVAAADACLAGGVTYALTRPPGHHAYASRAGGHCYLNNAALAALQLLAGGCTKVGVLDIDSHHGNGTQGIFWEREDVVVASVHANPNQYYPWYVGHASEKGAGRGAGFNCNMPLAFGTADAGWLEAIATAIAFLRAGGVQGIVVSLGFDASVHEPLAALAVTEDGFARAGELAGALSLPTVIVQEGGYALDHLGALLSRFIGGLQDRHLP